MEALFLLLIAKARGYNPRLLWFLPFLMILWVNLHPAAIIGVFVMFTYVAEIIVDEIKVGKPGVCGRLMGESFKRNLVVAFLVTPIAYLINPNTSIRYTALYEIVFKHTGFITSLDETMPASLSQDPFFYVLLFLCAIMLLHRWNRTAVSDMLLVIVLGVLALQWKRNVPLFAVGCIPFLTNSLNAVLFGDKRSPVTKWYSRNVVALEWTGIIGLIVSLPLIATSTSFGLGYVGARYPEMGIQYVEANKLKGNLFNIYDWGGFHIFWMYPDHRVFIDGRGPDVYTPEIWHEYEQIRDGSDNYDQLLDKYKVEIVFLSTGDRLRKLTEKLNRNPVWGCVFRDYVTAIYVRAGSENMKIASENNLKKAAIQAMNEGNMERTLELMADLKRVNPESVEAWLNSGIICAKYLKRYDEAIDNFRRVIEIDSVNVAARIYLAGIYELKGDRNESIAMLKEILRIDPANEAARQKLEVMTKK
jgi:hypothetical protein